VASSANAFIVTWCGVRGFESTRSTTVQATLLSTGVIEMTFGEQIDLVEGSRYRLGGRGISHPWI
jgi:hypothetical protein